MVAATQLESCLVEFDGLPYPNWDEIQSRVESNSPADRQEQWRAIGKHWLTALGAHFGEQYRVHETAHFLVLSAAKGSTATRLLTFFEQAHGDVLRGLPGLASAGPMQTHVALLFDHAEEYHAYIAPFGGEVINGGLYMPQGYGYFVFPTVEYQAYRATLVHELTHACTAHLPLPNWLSEAVAMRMEALCGDASRFLLDREEYQSHRAFWNKETIQAFWSGASFYRAGESVTLSYRLAAILLRKMETDLDATSLEILEFFKSAHSRDAGEAACARLFDCSLGHVLEDFLGPGEWHPDPLAWDWAQSS